VLSGQSLADGLLARVDPLARPAVQDMVYGTLRQFGAGDFRLGQLLVKPLADVEIRALLLLALYRLETWPESPHTVVDQAVTAAGELLEGRCRGLVNGVLRTFLRQRETLDQSAALNDVAQHRHPDWWLNLLRSTWPADWKRIVDAGNGLPPMALRVNVRQTTRDDYLEKLADTEIPGRPVGESGIHLARAVPVERLPYFAEGWVSVQDPGAQRAAEILAPQAGDRVLDACAAPGGKTAHLLERASLDLLALDLKPSRCRRIEDNLRRLGLAARVQVADCVRVERWWDGKPFDAILADVPCTASGVVRRHPDAKWLRREADVASFAATQSRILDALWRVLRPGGKLLYVTCSVFAAENQDQIQSFLARQSTAQSLFEEQLLPTAEHDAFYYCLLEKHA
jgi:16S rRNA (cytosine967-C5)-methyltransferase